MLETVFSFRNTEYKGNLLPDSFEHLLEAAQKIKAVHIENQKKLNGLPSADQEDPSDCNPSNSDVFFLTYQTKDSNQQRVITND